MERTGPLDQAPDPAETAAMLQIADPAQAVGERYELTGLLGQGGMADVYRAQDRMLGREVAVKILRGGVMDDTDRARFATEARLLATLSHPGVVTLLDAGIETSSPYLIMELVDGRTLRDRVREDGPLPAPEAMEIGAQLADVLAHAHENQVVHRDIKPSNVLLTREGRVKLADFGIARLIGDATRHTLTGQAIGTAAYLAPEQVTGKEVDGGADVYALGLVLLEAVTGCRAYSGSAVEAAVSRLARQPEIPADLPPAFAQVLRRMTALSPSERPTAAEAAVQLRAAARPGPRFDGAATAPIPVVGVPAGRRPAVSRLSGRALAVAAGVALLVVVVLVMVLASTGSKGGTNNPIPANTPAGLRQPLTALHTAVDG